MTQKRVATGELVVFAVFGLSLFAAVGTHTESHAHPVNVHSSESTIQLDSSIIAAGDESLRPGYWNYD
ncbi:MAG TPA: hypothetical protein VHX38_38015 [Pseudonocardiaceae bacterium]|jgi:hypothetical protein|nr:hypothetical protein [Pseudonocardiaceae bacterium]